MLIDIELLSGVIPHQVAMLGPDGRYVYVNTAFEARYGRSQEQLLGLDVSQVVGNDLSVKYAPFIEAALRGAGGELQHTFANRSDGRVWKTSFAPTPEGGCLIVSNDPGIENTRAARAQRTEERLQAFVDFAPIGMIFSHLDGRVLEANRAFLDLIGYTRADLERGEIQWDKLTPPEYLPLDYAAIAEAKETGFSRTYEKEYVTKSGERIHILVGFILVGSKREEAVAFVVDITAQKKAEEEVRELNSELERRVNLRTAELEEANRELEAFCYSVSHDLRAPLRSIDGFAFALYQDYQEKLDEEAQEYISRIRTSVKRMDELISALLVLSRITRAELDRQTVNLSELAEAVVAELAVQNPDRNVKVSIQPNLEVMADLRMLRVVLDNLLNNAFKFTSNRPEAQITISADFESAAFVIEDNGVGFDMGLSSKLFQPFERLHSPRDFAGNGIGLATVQRIIRKHGGKIWAQAEVDKGARFYFRI